MAIHPDAIDLLGAQSGTLRNVNKGVYEPGKSYPFLTKVKVDIKYHEQMNTEHYRKNGRVNISEVARRCGVSRNFVEKVKNERLLYGKILRRSEIYDMRDVPRGAGSIVMDEFDRFFILQLYSEEPSRTLKSYVDELWDYTGKNISKSTISRFFLEYFPIQGRFVKPNLVPYDKFRPANEAKAWDFLYMMSQCAPHRVKFGDEKLLKGQELYCRLVRRNPITGEIPDIMTDSDFRNTHSITGFCSIDERTNPIWYRIHKSNNNADQFRSDVEAAVATGFLLPEDVLVLDNAAYHTGKGNDILARWLWNKFGVFVMFLPARTPEWNPIELLWNTLVQRLNKKNLSQLRETYGSDCAAHAAKEVLDGMTHQEVAKYYRRCYRGL